MGMDARAYLIYGVDLGYECDVPWIDDEGDGHLEEYELWWEGLHGFKPEDIYDSDGEVMPEFIGEDGRLTEEGRYITARANDAQENFWKTHNFPVVVHSLGYDLTHPILGVPGVKSGITSWDGVKVLDADMFANTHDEEKLVKFKEFIARFFPEFKDVEPRWLLAATYS